MTHPRPLWCSACRADREYVRGEDGIWRCPGPHTPPPPEPPRAEALRELDARYWRDLYGSRR
jgi:hypothetical protein